MKECKNSTKYIEETTLTLCLRSLRTMPLNTALNTYFSGTQNLC